MFSLRTALSRSSSSFDPSFSHLSFVRFFQFGNLFPLSDDLSINQPPITVPRAILMALQSPDAEMFKNPAHHFSGGLFTNNHGAQIIHGEITGNNPQGMGIAEYKYIVMTNMGERGIIPCVVMMARVLPTVDINDEVYIQMHSATEVYGHDENSTPIVRDIALTQESEILRFFTFANAIMINILADKPLEIDAIAAKVSETPLHQYEQLFDYLTQHRTHATLLAQAAEYNAHARNFAPT